MAAPQDTIQCCCGSLHTRCISGALGTREEYHPHKISRNINHVCVDPCDFLSDSGLDLIRYESIFGDCGIEWHCVDPDHRHSLEHKCGFVQRSCRCYPVSARRVDGSWLERSVPIT